MIELANDHELLPSRRNPFDEPIDEPSMLAWNQVGVTDNSPRKWYALATCHQLGRCSAKSSLLNIVDEIFESFSRSGLTFHWLAMITKATVSRVTEKFHEESFLAYALDLLTGSFVNPKLLLYHRIEKYRNKDKCVPVRLVLVRGNLSTSYTEYNLCLGETIQNVRK